MAGVTTNLNFVSNNLDIAINGLKSQNTLKKGVKLGTNKRCTNNG